MRKARSSGRAGHALGSADIWRYTGRAGAASEYAGIWRHTGACRARHCAGSTFRLRGPIHTMALPGNPRGRAYQCISTSFEAGRRRAISVVAVLSRRPRATTPMVRRWAAAGGPEGRCFRKPRQRHASPAYRRVPLSLGHAIPTAVRLMGGRDARPRNTIRKAGVPGNRSRDKKVGHAGDGVARGELGRDRRSSLRPRFQRS